ncbi:Hypothetical_protein [Hexamita inflata]|uniref:Hypothetical_protein n=1 Tax=Hexamita inflata TaxID=28002 RepID=A0AA86PFA0_9EUKA|nr:Hypothetical protein HINF_LOCUS1918 [Hexamita inflata]CAI9934699.1 Hypothetical protein HINF_LOCUS22344 [Hexamita inflata]
MLDPEDIALFGENQCQYHYNRLCCEPDSSYLLLELGFQSTSNDSTQKRPQSCLKSRKPGSLRSHKDPSPGRTQIVSRRNMMFDWLVYVQHLQQNLTVSTLHPSESQNHLMWRPVSSRRAIQQRKYKKS